MEKLPNPNWSPLWPKWWPELKPCKRLEVGQVAADLQAADLQAVADQEAETNPFPKAQKISIDKIVKRRGQYDNHPDTHGLLGT